MFVHARARSQKRPALAAKSALLIRLIVQLFTASLSFLRHRWFGYFSFFFFFVIWFFAFFFKEINDTAVEEEREAI